ncbi:hypothetical protein DQ04_21381000 [Trypanosoma grayi]|uniref:hypothetical protein n=1 Tax=Trypanosoma grayi TaxID=71804 RepID=UPI0004F47696|nr:hypothetical protein DQ04_21381000 [Trypanosoma grayi]KEG05492.1 hypothetical protein DQ04_21381000 [Trypanosoma grayi]
MTAEQEGFCPQNGGGHTMMPIQESFQTLASQALASSGAQEAPIGAKNLHSTCTTQACEWLLTTGLMNGSTMEKATFFKGVVYNGEDHTVPVPGMYTNFQKGVQPVAFFTARDKILVKMVRTGQWENEVPATVYYTWVCEHYEFTPEESQTAPSTDDNGFLIPSPKKFPWWAGLLIAVAVCFFIVIVLLVCCCCRKYSKEKEEEREIEAVMNGGDNIHRIPTQSELGIGRSSSIYQDGDGGFGLGDSVYRRGGVSRENSVASMRRQSSVASMGQQIRLGSMRRQGSMVNPNGPGSMGDMRPLGGMGGEVPYGFNPFAGEYPEPNGFQPQGAFGGQVAYPPGGGYMQ